LLSGQGDQYKMGKEEYVGRKSSVVVDIRMNARGKWEATYTIDYYRTKDMLEWEKRRIALKTIADSEGEAISHASLLMENQLKKCNNDPFSVEQKELLHD
jgi:hypothetical protein